MFQSASFAQTAKEVVTGTVKTADGSPAEFITVALKNTLYSATTDIDGSFSLKAPAGEYTMVVFSITAHKKEFPVTIKAGEVNSFPDITIIEDSKQLDEIVVTGQFSRQSLRNSVYKVRVVNALQIEQRAATNVQSLLNTEIGIRLSNDLALGETDFELMGMSGNNVKVLIDGIPVVDRGSTKQSLSQIDVNSIEQIEIIEGPMSVIYGTDALAGVINIITKKADVSSGKNKVSAAVRLHEESVGGEYAPFSGDGIHNQSASLSWAHKTGFYVDGTFARNITGGWTGDKTGREKQWQPKDQFLYGGTVGFKKKSFNAWYRLDYMDETIFNAINPTALTPNEVSDRNFITNRYTHQLQSAWKVSSRLTLDVAGSFQDYSRRTRTTVSNTATGDRWLSIDPSAQDTSAITSWFGRATATWNLSTKLSLQPGLEYQWNQGSGDRIKGEPSIADFAAFLSAEWNPTDWVNLRPGVRAIISSDYDAPLAIPSLVTKFSLNHQMDLRVSYAYGFRAPTLRELYFSFHNANHNIDGNPNLRAEYSNNFTAFYTWRILHSGSIRLTSTLGGFYNDFRDRITTATSTQDPTLTTYYNIDHFKTTGGTFENALTWGQLQLNVGFSMVGRYNSLVDNSSLTDMDLPTFRFSPELTTTAMYRLKTGTDFSLFYKFTGERLEYQYDSAGGNVFLGGMGSFSWADFTITQKVYKWMNINAGVKNIFDVSTVSSSAVAGGTLRLVGSGRSYFIGLNFLFNN